MIGTDVNCDYFEMLISGELDGELTSDESRRLADHLPGCQSCQRIQNGFVQVDLVVDELGVIGQITTPSLEEQSGFVESGNVAIEPAVLRSQATIWMRALPIGIAASLLLAIGVMVWPAAEPVNAEQISRPMLEVARINQQTELDQKLMVKTLEFELRSLRLELSQITEDSDLRSLLDQRLNLLIEKVKTFEQTILGEQK